MIANRFNGVFHLLQSRLKFDKAEAIYNKLIAAKDVDPTLVSGVFLSPCALISAFL